MTLAEMRAQTTVGRLAPLAAGALVMGSGSLVIAGIVDLIATDLGQPVAVVGQLTPAFAIAFAAAAPVLSVVVGRFDRRTVLVWSLAGFAAANALGAVASTFTVLLTSRVLAGFAGAAFTPNAVAVAGLLVPPAARGRAIALVFGGFTLAAVVGVPIGIAIGLSTGWRATLTAVSLLAVMTALLVRIGLPRDIRIPPGDVRGWLAIGRDPRAVVLLATTTVSIAGTYTVFSFIGPVLRPAAGADAGLLVWLLMAFGAAGFVGNLASGRLIDRSGAGRTVALNQAGVVVGLGTLVMARGDLALTLLALVIWGGTVFSINTAQQARLIEHAPDLQAVLLSANSSFLYVGQFLGGTIGGVAVGHSDSLVWLPVIGMIMVVAGLALSCLADRVGPFGRPNGARPSRAT